ncbi:hypothetical protein LCGC14_2553090 [marine sediment metagenome]|uniref:DUF2441 domain-containing protein n=1 Tax=marine sediment metagenome TaxID=412755 RepID=A0A0F9BAA5_9ZZZZ
MIRVKNRVYYHCQRNNSTEKWKIGEKISFGSEYNLFFNNYRIDNRSFYCLFNGKEYHYIDYLYNIASKLPETDENIRNRGKIIELGLQRSTIILREYLFENIRKINFPDYPSRQKGLWLIESIDSLKYWKDTIFNKKGDIVLKLKVNGKAHKSYAEFIQADVFSLDLWEEMAFNYWKGTKGEELKSEIIFEGDVEVIEIL